MVEYRQTECNEVGLIEWGQGSLYGCSERHTGAKGTWNGDKGVEDGY